MPSIACVEKYISLLDQSVYFQQGTLTDLPILKNVFRISRLGLHMRFSKSRTRVKLRVSFQKGYRQHRIVLDLKYVIYRMLKSIFRVSIRKKTTLFNDLALIKATNANV